MGRAKMSLWMRSRPCSGSSRLGRKVRLPKLLRREVHSRTGMSSAGETERPVGRRAARNSRGRESTSRTVVRALLIRSARGPRRSVGKKPTLPVFSPHVTHRCFRISLTIQGSCRDRGPLEAAILLRKLARVAGLGFVLPRDRRALWERKPPASNGMGIAASFSCSPSRCLPSTIPMLTSYCCSRPSS